MRIALALEYDGRGYCGFQSQPSGCGVQDALERALREIGQRDIAATAAGRTDAGVHATSQIVHADVPDDRPLTAWVRGVNAHLPAAVAVLWAHPVDEAFHARFSATARHYAYLLLTRPERPALLSGRVGWYHRPLDLDAVRAGAAHLVGLHDFTSFRAAECQAKSPMKTIRRFDVTAAGDLVRFDISADAFLHHMVRNVVGALVAVGARRAPPSWIAELTAARDRTKGPATFAPDGLYFAGADYEARFGLPPTRRDVVIAAA
ncbi:tRNA pseudouridine synthase A [Burkholderiales bacterium]|nr:tRNA pseudouridine synthase A [Burkholderiales bacterium]